MYRAFPFIRIAVAAFVLAVGLTVSTATAASAATSAEAEFDGLVNGRITFSALQGNNVRMTGQLNAGLIDPVGSNYQFQVRNPGGDLVRDVSNELRPYINPPGSSPFQVDIPNSSVDDFVGNRFKIKYLGIEIGDAEIRAT